MLPLKAKNDKKRLNRVELKRGWSAYDTHAYTVELNTWAELLKLVILHDLWDDKCVNATYVHAFPIFKHIKSDIIIK